MRRAAGVWLVALLGLAVAPVVAHASSLTAYVTNGLTNGAGGLSQYTVGAGGALSPMATPTVAGGDAPSAVAISPDGASVYVANRSTDGAGGVSQYAVGPGGALAPMATPTVAAGSNPTAIAVSPNGRSVYVANVSSNDVSQYTVGAGGALTPMATATVAAGSNPDGIAVSPNGRSVYAANDNTNGAGGVSQYTVGTGGALTPMATPTVAAGDGPYGVTVSPHGTAVYVTNHSTDGAGGVSQYTVGPGGALSPMATATVAAGDTPRAITMSPDGRSAYVANFQVEGAGGVSQYTVGAGGALAPMPTPTVPVDTEPSGIAVNADGRSVYVANFGSNNLSQYVAGAGGGLTAMATATVGAGTGSGAIAVLPDQGPVAAFSAVAKRAGTPTTFNASASSAPDGTVARYTWSFGDGVTQTLTSPSISHTYKKGGTFTATLTVIDGDGCSTTVVFTGQTASCNGGSAGATSRPLKVPATPPPLPPPPKPKPTPKPKPIIGPPSAQITSPDAGARYTRGQVAGAGYSCHDAAGGPGIASCVGPITSGEPIDTTTAGPHTFTVTATSKDGQTGSATVTYTVISPSNRFTLSRFKRWRGGAVPVQVKVPGPGAITVLAQARAGRHARPFRFATRRRAARRAGAVTLRVAPNARLRRLIRGTTTTVRITVSVTYTPTGGLRRTVTRTVRLRA